MHSDGKRLTLKQAARLRKAELDELRVKREAMEDYTALVFYILFEMPRQE